MADPRGSAEEGWPVVVADSALVPDVETIQAQAVDVELDVVEERIGSFEMGKMMPQ